MQQQQQQQQQQPVSIQTQMMQPAMVLSSSSVAPQQPIPGYVTVQGTVHPGFVEAYLARQSKGIGITLILIGTIAIIANAIGNGFGDYFGPVGHGFWCGIMFITTGSFGIAAASKRRCLIVVFMVKAILSAIITILLLGFGIGGAIDNTTCRYSTYYHTYRCDNVHKGVSIAMESLLAILAVPAAIVSIWGSAICCKAVCCCAPNPYNGLIVTAPYGSPQMFVQQPGSVVQYGHQQVMTVPMYPASYQVQPVSGGYPQTQQPYSYSTAFAPPPEGPSASGAFIPPASAPPAYAEFANQKG